MKTIYVNNDAKTSALLNKGGIMFFTVERPACVYSGMVVLTPVEEGCRRRAVYITGYKHNGGGAQ